MLSHFDFSTGRTSDLLHNGVLTTPAGSQVLNSAGEAELRLAGDEAQIVYDPEMDCPSDGCHAWTIGIEYSTFLL